MTRRSDQPLRIVDKRHTNSGIEYLISLTGEWVSSSTCRCVNPELVELYEWLHNSGYREGATVFASLHRTNFTSAKGARKRVQSALTPRESGELSYEHDPDQSIISVAMTSLVSEGDMKKGPDMSWDIGSAFIPEDDSRQELDPNESVVLDGHDGDQDGLDPPKTKKPRIDRACVTGLGSLTIDSTEDLTTILPRELTHPNLIAPQQDQPPTLSGAGDKAYKETVTSASQPQREQEQKQEEKQDQAHEQTEEQKSEQKPEEKPEHRIDQKQAVLEFNRNTEQMIELYLKEGLFDRRSQTRQESTCLTFYSDPTVVPQTSFFYSLVLSPNTDQANVEAAIHVLDRALTLHGPEPFQDIWDVQKRRREVADGSSALSGGSLPETLDLFGFGFGSRSRKNTNAEDALEDLPISYSRPRLPSWNNTWDLIKTEFGLDLKSESKLYISLQERNIRMRLQGTDAAQDPSSTKNEVEEENQEPAIKEEREIRDEVGRAIVGLLIRVLEQDSVMKNVSSESFFYRDVLGIKTYSPTHAVRQALDVIFQICGVALSSRYLETPCLTASSSISGSKADSTTAPSSTGAASNTSRSAATWPLNERCKLNSVGMEILQLGQQFLLLLIRFVEAGEVALGRGLEDLVMEVQSRLNKLNRDREVPGGSSKRTGSKASSGTVPGMHYFLERCTLDQTEIFLKSLLQGPCLLDWGTGSGAGVKLRKEKAAQSDTAIGPGTSTGTGTGTDADTGANGSSGENEYRTIFKSQTGTCMGSSTFVMILVDYWFRSKTTSGGAHSRLSFRNVVEDYAMPNELRVSASAAANNNTSKKKEKGKGPKEKGKKAAEKSKVTGKRKPSKPQKTPASSDNEEDSDQEHPVEQWNAKDLEQVEWTVMMIEVLVWAWIEARGIRRDEIEGTGLEMILYPDSNGQSKQNAREDSESGWITMSKLLKKVGGTLRSRWEQLESVIEAAIMVEDLGLR
ncbi:hypothetical protein BGX31_010368 [Mortierella sp. GBA43]|nr:hypothetical protein BGX31_010368 [Mortierella sp. GBA43]